jgi:hypothetical protein
MGMAQDERSPGEYIINEAVAIHIIQVGTFTTLDEQWLPTNGAEGPDW